MKKGQVKENSRYKGLINNINQSEKFYVVYLLNDGIGDIVRNQKYKDYNEAFEQCLKMTKEKNYTGYILECITEINLLPNVTQF